MVHGRGTTDSRDVLKQKLLNAGIDEAFMPAEIRFRTHCRATTAVERKRKRIEAGIIENYLVKEVSSDMEHVLRFIVRETKDARVNALNMIHGLLKSLIKILLNFLGV